MKLVSTKSKERMRDGARFGSRVCQKGMKASALALTGFTIIGLVCALTTDSLDSSIKKDKEGGRR